MPIIQGDVGAELQGASVQGLEMSYPSFDDVGTFIHTRGSSMNLPHTRIRHSNIIRDISSGWEDFINQIIKEVSLPLVQLRSQDVLDSTSNIDDQSLQKENLPLPSSGSQASSTLEDGYNHPKDSDLCYGDAPLFEKLFDPRDLDSTPNIDRQLCQDIVNENLPLPNVPSSSHTSSTLVCYGDGRTFEVQASSISSEFEDGELEDEYDHLRDSDFCYVDCQTFKERCDHGDLDSTANINDQSLRDILPLLSSSFSTSLELENGKDSDLFYGECEASKEFLDPWIWVSLRPQ